MGTIIDETIDSVKEQITYIEEQISFYEKRITDPTTRNIKFFQHHLTQHTKILGYLFKYINILENPSQDSARPSSSDYISIRPEDIKGVPKEVLDELSLTESDHAEFDIINTIKNHGGIMSLDHIILTTYRETGEIPKRRLLTAKLYRMVNKGLIFSVPDKRGTYTTDRSMGEPNIVDDNQGED